jgi:paraquat-inducible protein A
MTSSRSTPFTAPIAAPPAFALAFTLSALILYVPANVLPIMRFEYFGAVQDNTVWRGIVNLWKGNMPVVATVVFIFSMVAPLFKLVMLLALAVPAQSPERRALQTRIYRILRVIESWSMLDIFLLSVLVALVKLGQLANVDALPGALAFTLMVVFSLAATQTLDPTPFAPACDES